MIRELNSRGTSYGLFVALLWDDETNETFIAMETEDSSALFIVESEDAFAAFSHPFVYRTNAVHVDPDGTRYYDPEFQIIPPDES